MIGRKHDWSRQVRSPLAVLAVWAIYCLMTLAIQAVIGWDDYGADDWTRLIEVRAWLDGQSWWDVTQYRMNPPDGFSMHWSRLVDVPLALAVLVVGETAASAIVPLLWLLVALFALRAIMLRLGLGALALGIGLVLFPLFPLLPTTFAPLRIDHHVPQVTLGLICVALMLVPHRMAAIAAGLCAATWVVVSLEGLPLVAAFAGLYGLRYLWAEQKLLGWFLGTLALGSAGLTYATRTPDYLALGFCDVLLPGHILVFAVATLAGFVGPLLPGQHRAAGRLLALGLVPLASIPVALLVLGPCASDPMTAFDPLITQYWHGFILEGLPIHHQPLSMRLVLLWPVLLALAGWWVAGRNGMFDEGRGLAWTLYAAGTLMAGLYSLYLLRAGVMAQLMAIPLAAMLLAHFLPRARAIAGAGPRIVATLACFALTTPVFASALAKPFDQVYARHNPQAQAMSLRELEPCDYTRLRQLPQGLIFTTLDQSPEILGLTQHSVLAAGYHRNQRPIRMVIEAMIGPPGAARPIVQGSTAQYVVVCSSVGDLAMYRSVAPDNFANRLISGDVPAWLEPVAGFEQGNLRVYRVRYQ